MGNGQTPCMLGDSKRAHSLSRGSYAVSGVRKNVLRDEAIRTGLTDLCRAHWSAQLTEVRGPPFRVPTTSSVIQDVDKGA